MPLYAERFAFATLYRQQRRCYMLMMLPLPLRAYYAARHAASAIHTSGCRVRAMLIHC